MERQSVSREMENAMRGYRIYTDLLALHKNIQQEKSGDPTISKACINNMADYCRERLPENLIELLQIRRI